MKFPSKSTVDGANDVSHWNSAQRMMIMMVFLSGVATTLSFIVTRAREKVTWISLASLQMTSEYSLETEAIDADTSLVAFRWKDHLDLHNGSQYREQLHHALMKHCFATDYTTFACFSLPVQKSHFMIVVAPTAMMLPLDFILPCPTQTERKSNRNVEIFGSSRDVSSSKSARDVVANTRLTSCAYSPCPAVLFPIASITTANGSKRRGGGIRRVRRREGSRGGRVRRGRRGEDVERRSSKVQGSDFRVFSRTFSDPDTKLSNHAQKNRESSAPAHESDRSVKSGVNSIQRCPREMKQVSNARLQKTANMRVHRYLHAKNAERCNTTRLRAANSATKITHTSLHLPPVSMAKTTK